MTGYFRPMAWPIAAHAAVWAGDRTGARSLLDAFDGAALRGAAIELDHATLRASVAGLEGRASEALTGFREAIKGYRNLGLVFDSALATIDLASVLGEAELANPEAAGLIVEARATLTGLGAGPFLEQLERALSSGRPAPASVGTRTTARVS